MAIDTLQLKLRFCLEDNCSTLKIYDTTGVYDATDNVGGWGATNINPSNVTTGTLTYTLPNGSAATLDVTSVITAIGTATEAEFLLAEVSIDPQDGTYSFAYSVEDGNGIAGTTKSGFTTCVVRCCVDKLWAKAAQELVDDCGCSGSSTPYSDKAMHAESLINSINNSIGCGNTATASNLLQKLQRICALEKCNC